MPAYALSKVLLDHASSSIHRLSPAHGTSIILVHQLYRSMSPWTDYTYHLTDLDNGVCLNTSINNGHHTPFKPAPLVDGLAMCTAKCCS